jgi:hypothetical protein
VGQFWGGKANLCVRVLVCVHTCCLPTSTPFSLHVARDLALLLHGDRRSNTPSSPGLPRTPHGMARTSSRNTCRRILVVMLKRRFDATLKDEGCLRIFGIQDTSGGVCVYYTGCVSQNGRGMRIGDAGSKPRLSHALSHRQPPFLPPKLQLTSSRRGLHAYSYRAYRVLLGAPPPRLSPTLLRRASSGGAGEG